MRKLISTDSSNVRSVTLEEGGASLVVEFSSGGVYRYANCTVAMFAEAASAPSLGVWVQANLVKERVKRPCTKVMQASPPATPGVGAAFLALQAIASLSKTNRSPDVVELVNTARAALEGREPPPLPDGWPTPRVVIRDDTVKWVSCVGLSLTLDAEGDLVTPDQATAIAHALLTAALEARL